MTRYSNDQDEIIVQNKRVLITGSSGTIGTAISNRLTNVAITPFDLPTHDALDSEALRIALPNHDVVIHLAQSRSRGENAQSRVFDPNNSVMMHNVLSQALSCGVKRVVIASSVHADAFPLSDGKRSTTNRIPVPDSPYGANKVLGESLGRMYAKEGLEVVAIRFGGVNSQDLPPTEAKDQRELYVWLTQTDCASLIQHVIDAESIPNNYCCVNAVSNNLGRIHDTDNPFGWTPGPGYSGH